MTVPAEREHTKVNRTWVGRSIRRVEDPKFLRGQAAATSATGHAARDAARRPYCVKSPYAHSRITWRSTPPRPLEQVPGVVNAVITGAQAAELCDPLPDFGPNPAAHTWRCLAKEKVRYVGEGVAVVVADSRYLAEDALAP